MSGGRYRRRGQVALVVGNEVVTAPRITAPSYAPDAISVVGPFTEDEARALADTLAG